MTEDEAVALMIDGAFQEEAQARAKYNRARLSSTQLSTYFVGWQQILKLREEQKAAKGAAFVLREFNDALLSHGTPPLPFVREVFFSSEASVGGRG